MENKKVLNIDFETFLSIVRKTCEAHMSCNTDPYISSNKLEWFVKQFDEVNITYKKGIEEDGK